MTFEQWMDKIDRILEYNLGISYRDLPDIDYRSLFESEVPAIEAAAIAIKNAGYTG